jgi:hypothetical protein
MGLQKADSDNHGNTYPTAYLNMLFVQLDTKRGTCRYSLAAYKDKAYRDANGNPFRRYNRSISGDDWATYCGVTALDAADMNLVKSIYAHAKTTFGEEELTDILE